MASYTHDTPRTRVDHRYGGARYYTPDGTYLYTVADDRLGCHCYDPYDIFKPLPSPASLPVVYKSISTKLRLEGVTSYILLYGLYRKRVFHKEGGFVHTRWDPTGIETILVVIPTDFEETTPKLKELVETAGNEAFGTAGLKGRAVVVFADVLGWENNGCVSNNFHCGRLLCPTRFDSPRPGASIGVRGCDERRSFGCYLREKNGSRVFGLTTAEFCRGYPSGTVVEQPTNQDLMSLIGEKRGRMRSLVEIMKYEVTLRGDAAKESLSYKHGQEDVQRLEIEIGKLEALDRTFATTTEYTELGVVDGIYHDYMLLEVLPSRLGENWLAPFKDFHYGYPVNPNEPLSMDDLLHLDKDYTVKIDGRDVDDHDQRDGASGTLSSFPALVKFDWEECPFRCTYAYQVGSSLGASIAGKGNCGSIARAGPSRGVAMVVGGADIEGGRVRISLLVDMRRLLERISARWGLSLEIVPYNASTRPAVKD
ncbi:hypothetical protein BJ508DRAFT_359212 [Ascobolus immersus RN42]|uniref:Uncharacterized protein n=1 Tax=Ascobolus immersus RN42 TaxID=1160509 RepID=A0A3N4ILQ2_ASCIM|nr:hypothetical protein BJ508DRAFT_359212 [Ascobolus immersus RN42]